MVTAGVYMIVRNHVIFDLSPTALGVVGLVGGATALFAATIGLVQNDIKRVLAYSTVSQLGYMFLMRNRRLHRRYFPSHDACLLQGAVVPLRRLGDPCVIRRARHSEDGRTQPKNPWTHKLFFIGTIAIAGIPPFAGFWSKDEIMAHAFTHHHYVLYGMAAIGALLTSFYMFRLTYLTFYGQSRMDHHTEEHVHESPMVMIGPLMVLGLLSVAGGFLDFLPIMAGYINSWRQPQVPAANMKSAPGWSCP